MIRLILMFIPQKVYNILIYINLKCATCIYGKSQMRIFDWVESDVYDVKNIPDQNYVILCACFFYVLICDNLNSLINVRFGKCRNYIPWLKLWWIVTVKRHAKTALSERRHQKNNAKKWPRANVIGRTYYSHSYRQKGEKIETKAHRRACFGYSWRAAGGWGWLEEVGELSKFEALFYIEIFS